MRLWRSSDHADLSGRGGLRFAGRWHSRGTSVVYLSDHPASTLLEILVHLEVASEDLPDTYQLLAIDIPDDVHFDSIAEDQLTAGWRENTALTRALGDQWLGDNGATLLKVPSAIVPASVNWLLNPAHADSAKARVAEIIRVQFDQRLFRTG